MFWQGGPDGTALGYAPWHSGEPNNWPDEDFAAIRHVDDWNDLNPDFTMYTTGYLVEFSPVPEPGTIAMMIVFCIVLGAYSVRARVPR